MDIYVENQYIEKHHLVEKSQMYFLAVNRSYNKSDYIPCIAWGRNAKFCETVAVGTEIKVVGRVQSRQYEKKHEDGTSRK